MLPLRLCLVLAILAGLGVIGISQFVLRPHVTEIIRVRDENKTGWDKAKVENQKLTKSLRETTDELTRTKAELETTKAQLADANAQLEKDRKRIQELTALSESQKTQLKKLGDDLAAWLALGPPVDQVSGIIQREKALSKDNEALKEEGKLFAADAKLWKERYQALLGNDIDPPVPATVRGKVMVVDPKWDFLVLDVGASQRVPEKGVLLISRNGSLVAKVRVMNVQGDRCIANIMPGWKLKDVMEGDLVFPYKPTNL